MGGLMESIIRDFLNSELTESDFFGLSKEDLISLKEYLELLIEIDAKYQSLIKEQFDSIKKKCDWIERVGFASSQQETTGKYLKSWLNLFATDGINLSASLTNGDVEYIDLARIPSIYLLSKRNRIRSNRQEELSLIQNELHEIDEVGRKLYDGTLYPQKTISDYFTIDYTPELGIDLFGNNDEYSNDLIARYYKRSDKYYDKPILNDEVKKEKLLTRIQIKDKSNQKY